MLAMITCLLLRSEPVENDPDKTEIERLQKENENLRSKTAELKNEITSKESEVDSLKSKKSEVVVRYKTLREESTDTLFVYIADSLNKVNDEIIDTLERGLDACYKVITLQENIIKNDSASFIEYEDIIKYQTATIAKLERTWWDRNKMWVGLIGGTIVGSLGTYAIMR